MLIVTEGHAIEEAFGDVVLIDELPRGAAITRAVEPRGLSGACAHGDAVLGIYGFEVAEIQLLVDLSKAPGFASVDGSANATFRAKPANLRIDSVESTNGGVDSRGETCLMKVHVGLPAGPGIE